MQGRLKRLERRIRPQRPHPLPEAAMEYAEESSRVPDTIRVSFEDGTTAVYDRHEDQPAPLVYRNIQIIQSWQGYTPPSLRKEQSDAQDQRKVLPQI